MIIARYNDKNTKDLLDFIDNEYPFVFTQSYHDFEQDQGNDIAIIISDDKTISIPVRFYKRFVFCFGQCLYPPVRHAKRINKNEEKDYLEGLVSFVKAKKLCHRIIQPFLLDVFYAYPQNSEYCGFGSYNINLAKYTEEEIFANFRINYRNEIRYALKKGVIIKYGKDEFENFYKIYKQTMNRENKFCDSHKFLKNYYSSLTDTNAICAVAYHNDISQAGLFAAFSPYGIYYLYGGTLLNSEISGITKLLFWEVMRISKLKGVNKCVIGGSRLSDVTGTKLDNLQKFKKRFGSELDTGYLWKMDINPVYSKIFDKLFTIKYYLKGKKPPIDIIDHEVLISNQ